MWLSSLQPTGWPKQDNSALTAEEWWSYLFCIYYITLIILWITFQTMAANNIGSSNISNSLIHPVSKSSSVSLNIKADYQVQSGSKMDLEQLQHMINCTVKVWLSFVNLAQFIIIHNSIMLWTEEPKGRAEQIWLASFTGIPGRWTSSQRCSHRNIKGIQRNSGPII